VENYIPLIIMLLLGAFFRGKKKQEAPEESQTKPFTAQQGHPNGPAKNLKEMTRDMYREFQQEAKREAERQRPTVQTTQMAMPRLQDNLTPKPVEVSNSPTRDRRAPSKGRQSTRGKPVISVKTEKLKIKTESLLPKNKDDLIKGVIFSEIFGPPKSKR
jgi:hypothetical protein